MSSMKLKDHTEKWIVCRICLQQPSTGLESIFCLNNNQDLTLMILECGGVPIKKFDHYPDKICSKCLKHLQVAYVFRKTCQQSHKHLSNLIAPVDLDDEMQEITVFVEEDNTQELKLKFPTKNGEAGTETEMVLDMSNVFTDEIEEFVPEDREITNSAKIKVTKSTSSMAKDNEKQIISLGEKNVKNLDLSIKLKEEIEDEETEEFIREDTNGKDPVIYYKNTESKLQLQDNQKICENEMILDKMVQNENEKLVEEDKIECLDELENEIFANTSDEEYVPLTKKSSAHKNKVKRKDKTLKSSSERITITKKKKRVILDKTIISANTSDKESEKSSFNCKTCERTFTGYTALKRHQRTHLNERPFNCDTCGLTFTRKASLDYHMRTHTGERPYKCIYCPASFAAKHTLKNHHRTHTNERPYDCDICGRSFKVKHGLARHIRTHTGERPYKCSFCPKLFADNDKRQKHHRSFHTNDTNDHSYACDICDKSFPILYNLKRHKVEVHNIIDTESNLSLKIYKCEICERSFVEKAHLRRHTKKHSSGERP